MYDMKLVMASTVGLYDDKELIPQLKPRSVSSLKEHENKIIVDEEEIRIESQANSFDIGIKEEIIKITLNFANIQAGTLEFNLNKIKNMIKDLISSNPGILTSEILEEIDYDEWAILELLDELKDKGELE